MKYIFAMISSFFFWLTLTYSGRWIMAAVFTAFATIDIIVKERNQES